MQVENLEDTTENKIHMDIAGWPVCVCVCGL